MRNFLKIAERVGVVPLLLEIERQPELWNRNNARLLKEGPHHQTSDIWLRYKDETENKKTGDYSNFRDPHDGVWYPSYHSLPSSRRLIFDLMARVEGERLGGVLIYKVPPGKEIFPHIDTGWHVEFYDKFNIAIKSQAGCTFFYENEKMCAKSGDVHWFTNNRTHWVKNESDEDQIILTVCIRTHHFSNAVNAIDSLNATGEMNK